jgi:hypothetical protein
MQAGNMDNSYTFIGGAKGAWRVVAMRGVCGDMLAPVEHVHVVNGLPVGQTDSPSAAWCLQGLTSNVRYADRTEVDSLVARQPALDRPEATRAALIPIKKSARWWALPQNERRAIFEETSHHTQIGLDYLPAIARRLHHCRDIGEPFDFLTWFEYAPEHADAFERLVNALRATPEWDYVEREIDIRLVRADQHV